MFGRSWRLFKQTWGVLRAERSLLWFPVMSAVVSFVVLAVIFGMAAALVATVPELGDWWDRTISDAGATGGSTTAGSTVGDTGGSGDTGSTLAAVVGAAVLFVISMLLAFVSTYYQGGLIASALVRLRGGDTTFREGIRVARSRWTKLLGFAAMIATVGVIRSLLEQRGRKGRMAGRAVDVGWKLASFLAVPLIVDQDVGPGTAMKQSTVRLKRTWGEQVVGVTGIGIVLAIPTLLAAAVFGGGAAWAISNDMIEIAIALIAVLVVVVVMISVVGAALKGVYRAAVYQYSETGGVGAGLDRDLVAGAFRRG